MRRTISAFCSELIFFILSSPLPHNQRTLACGEDRCLDMRHATSSAFKGVKVGEVAKSRRHSREPHDLSAAWAMRRCWRAFIRELVGHGQRSLEPRCSRHPVPVSFRYEVRSRKTCDLRTNSCFDAPMHGLGYLTKVRGSDEG